MGLVVPSSCANFRALRPPLFCVDLFSRLFERVFCPHPSLTALFSKYPMSAINPTNNSSNTHSWFTNLIPDTTPSHVHSSTSIVTLIASSINLRHVIQIRGAGYTLCNPRSPCTLRFTQILLSVHSTFPTLLLANIFHQSKSPVQHCALYKKNHYVAMYKLLLGSIHASVRFLNPVVCSRPLACVAVHTLACSYHHHSFAAFFHSFIVLALYVYFLRIVLSGFSPVVCLFLIGPWQRDICSAVQVLRNLQITGYFVSDLI